MAHTSLPDSLRSFGNGDAYLSHKHLRVGPLADFGGGCRLKKQLDRFDQVATRLLYRSALTGNIQFRAQGDIPILIAFLASPILLSIGAILALAGLVAAIRLLPLSPLAPSTREPWRDRLYQALVILAIAMRAARSWSAAATAAGGSIKPRWSIGAGRC